MKHLLSKSFLVLIVFALVSCYGKKNNDLLEDIKKSNDNIEEILTSDSCRYDQSPEDVYDLNLDLKFNCDPLKFEPLHLDLVVGIGLLGNVQLTGNKVDSMKVLLKEVGLCSRYDLQNVVYDGWNEKNDGTIVHDFTAKIEAGQNVETPILVDLTKGLDSDKNQIKDLILKKGDIIDIHIDSEDITINTKGRVNIKTNFGQQFCKSVVTGP